MFTRTIMEEVPSKIHRGHPDMAKIRKHINPITSESQILPCATMLKRGRLSLGVLLCIRGNKVHYYSFITQGKLAVYEEWLFKMPVQLGQVRVKDFNQLKQLMTGKQVDNNSNSSNNLENRNKGNNLENRNKCERKSCAKCTNYDFAAIRATFDKIEATVLTNTINSNFERIFHTINNLEDSLHGKIEDVNNKTRILEDDIQLVIDQNLSLNRKIDELKTLIGSLDLTHEVHVSNSIAFQDCYFNSQAANLFEEQSTAGDTTMHDSEEKDSSTHHMDSKHDYHESEEDHEIRVFSVGDYIQRHHWDKFRRYYMKMEILDVVYAEIEWLKRYNYLEAVEQLAPLVMGRSPPIINQPKDQSLNTIFGILRTSRICR